MFSAGMTAETLRDCLLNLPALELLGMKLLHRQPIGSFLTFVSIGDMPAIRSLPICREELDVFR